MEFNELLKKRRSIRAFEPRPVEAAKLQSVLEAADAAPSAGNLQAYRMVCVTDRSVLRALAAAAHGQGFVAEAPAAIVFLADPGYASSRYGEPGRRLFCIQDATIACAYAQLRAADLDLGSVWVGAFDEGAVSRAVEAPRDLVPVAVLPLGYPAEHPGPAPRRGIAGLVSRDRMG
jgi:nitroreductase